MDIPARIRQAALAIALTIVAVMPSVGAELASAEPPPPTCPGGDRVYTGESPRLELGSLQIEGRPYRYSVLLPTNYARTDRSYPVLYWLHGASGNHVSAFTDPLTPRFMEDLTEGEPAIVVMPEGGWVGMYSDWGVPGHQWETFHRRLIKHVDATYRTRDRRSGRAVAGFSMGGMGAIKYAARHPQRFTAAASFSGLLDTSFRSPLMKAFLTGAGPIVYGACAPNAIGPWGDPVTKRHIWERHNPTALVDELRGTSIYVATGDGAPCDEEDTRVLARETPTNPLRGIEPMVYDANQTFHQEMLAARVPHVYNPGCGIHSWRYWERELRAWWPQMMKAFRDRGRRGRDR